MPSADQWRTWAATIQVEGGRERATATRELYAAARHDARIAVPTKWQVDDDTLADLMHEVLAVQWDAVLGADSPKALFLVALKRKAIDRFRRQVKRETPLEALSPALEPSTDADPFARATVEKIATFLESALSARDLRVFQAKVILGESSVDVAETEGLSQANVDQIVSRARKKLKERFGAGS